MADSLSLAVTALETGFGVAFFALYLALLFTVAVLTWRKGHKVLFFVGFVFPFLWLVGAILAPGGGIDYGMHSGRR